MAKLTIAQCLPELNSGGVEMSVLEVAEGIIAHGDNAIIISAPGKLVKQCEQLGAQHIALAIGKKSLGSLRHIPRLMQLFQQYQVDIIHAQSRLPAWLTYIAYKRMRQKPHFITTMHGLHSINAYSRIMNRGEVVIAVSKTVQDYLHTHYHCAKDKIHLIYQGIEPLEFPYNHKPTKQWVDYWQQQYPQCKTHKILTLPGRISRRKGHQDFLQLLSALQARNIKCIGLIVGDTDKHQRYLQTLKQDIERLNIEVIFTGQRNDMKDIYAISDIVYSLSQKPESFGRTVLEALSIGTPVVAYQHGGVGEILDALFPSGAVPFRQLNALIDRSYAQLQQPQKVAQGQPFLRSTMINQTLELYHSLCH